MDLNLSTTSKPWWQTDVYNLDKAVPEAVLEHCRRLGVPFYYLGYWVQGSAAMEYKADFRPAEVLHPDGVWRRMDASPVRPD